jgi:hypothetical protein
LDQIGRARYKIALRIRYLGDVFVSHRDFVEPALMSVTSRSRKKLFTSFQLNFSFAALQLIKRPAPCDAEFKDRRCLCRSQQIPASPLSRK